jgi:transcriptional regulator with XRE-family HTH domain
MAQRPSPTPFSKRLMKLRKERNLTLSHLANETGLSPKYLTQVEKGEVIPPVSVILQVSRALEIDSGLLLQQEKNRSGTRSAEDYEKRTSDYSYQNLTPEAKHKHLKAFKIFVDPRSDHRGVSYQHAGEEFVYVLKGRMEIWVGENRSLLSPGGCLHFNSSIVHKLRNISDEKAELLVILYTP